MRIKCTNVELFEMFSDSMRIKLSDDQYSAESDLLSSSEITILADFCLSAMNGDDANKFILDWMENINYELVFEKIYPAIKNQQWFNEIIVKEEIKKLVEG